MDKKDFKVLFETPEYINTSGSTEEFMKGIKSKIKEEFNEAHKEASEISMPELESHLETLKMVDLVTEWMLKVNAQLDQLSERQAEIYTILLPSKED